MIYSIKLPTWPLSETLDSLFQCVDKAVAAGITRFDIDGAWTRDHMDGINRERYLEPAVELSRYIVAKCPYAFLRWQVFNVAKKPLALSREHLNYTEVKYPTSDMPRRFTAENLIEWDRIAEPFKGRRFVCTVTVDNPNGARVLIDNPDLPDSKLLDTRLAGGTHKIPFIIPNDVSCLRFLLPHTCNFIEELAPDKSRIDTPQGYYKYLGELKPDGELWPYQSPCANADWAKPVVAAHQLRHADSFRKYMAAKDARVNQIHLGGDEWRWLQSNEASRAKFKNCGEEAGTIIRRAGSKCVVNGTSATYWWEAGMQRFDGTHGYHACNMRNGGFRDMLFQIPASAGQPLFWGEEEQFTVENFLWASWGGRKAIQVINLSGNAQTQREANVQLRRALPSHVKTNTDELHLYTESEAEFERAIEEKSIFEKETRRRIACHRLNFKVTAPSC